MTTYREEKAADVRVDAVSTTDEATSAATSRPDGRKAPRPPEDGELMGAVLDLVHDLDGQVTHLKAALQSNRRIGIAMGIVMSQLRISDDEAFAALRQVSQRTNRKLHDVAEDVIYAGHLSADR